MKFCALASGSKGNAIFFANHTTQLLIDAGISARDLENRMNGISESVSNIEAICITHEHEDHIRGLITLSKKYQMKIYLTRKCFDIIPDNTKLLNHVEFFESGKAFSIGDFTITSFPIPHDAIDPQGFVIRDKQKSVALTTDLGYVTHVVRSRLKDQDWIIIESNHDEEMLKNGPYPWHLKHRVLSKHGHLSNISAGIAIQESYHRNLKGVSLAHLSETNNTPELAYSTVEAELTQSGIKNLKVCMTSQRQVSDMIEL